MVACSSWYQQLFCFWNLNVADKYLILKKVTLLFTVRIKCHFISTYIFFSGMDNTSNLKAYSYFPIILKVSWYLKYLREFFGFIYRVKNCTLFSIQIIVNDCCGVIVFFKILVWLKIFFQYIMHFKDTKLKVLFLVGFVI